MTWFGWMIEQTCPSYGSVNRYRVTLVVTMTPGFTQPSREFTTRAPTSLLRTLDAVLRAADRPLLLVRVRRSDRALAVEGSSDDVVLDTGKVLYAATTDEDARVFRDVCLLPGIVCPHHHAVRQTDTGDATFGGVGLLGGDDL